MNWRRHFRAAAQATDPSPEAAVRLRRRLAWPRELLQAAATAPEREATARLVARLRRTPARPSHTLWVVGGAVAVAAALLATFIAAQRPTSLDEELTALLTTTRELTPEIHTEYHGSGRVSGTSRAPRVRWEVGTLGLDVEPHRGIDLAVETEEGVITVVGTAFSVTRDVLGTSVSVDRGAVTVACTAVRPVLVEAGGNALCLPTRAAGMLARAQRLLDDGAGTPDVLMAIARGLGLATPDDPARGELLVLRIQVLLPLARDEEVALDARAYLARGGPRSAEVRAILDAVTPHSP